jgi:hypothetical protein
MSEPLKIVIKTSPGKAMSIEVFNAQGTECTQATQALNKLGSVQTVDYKPEYQEGNANTHISLGI